MSSGGNSDKERLRLLLIEKDQDFASRIKAYLSSKKHFAFDFKWVDSLFTATEVLSSEPAHVIIFSLDSDAEQGLDAAMRLRIFAPESPMILITKAYDEALALEAIKSGVQDCLVKKTLTRQQLFRSVTFAIERHRVLLEAKWSSQLDPLTGLFNRRGFLDHVDKQMRLAKRNQRKAVLLFMDLDDLKGINDRAGHKTGDMAIVQTAQVLMKEFRESDIVARIGGDEFVVFALETDGRSEERLMKRLYKRLEVFNRSAEHGFSLSLSIGAAHFDPAAPAPIEDLLSEADMDLYKGKNEKRTAVLDSVEL